MLWFVIWPVLIIGGTVFYLVRNWTGQTEKFLSILFSILFSACAALFSNLLVAWATSPVWDVQPPVHLVGKTFAIMHDGEWQLRAMGEDGKVYQSQEGGTRAVLHNSPDNTVVVKRAVPANRLWLIGETSDDVVVFNIPTADIVYK